MLNYFSKNIRFVLGVGIIALGCVLVWLPYFTYMPITGLGVDSLLYYNVLTGIEQNTNLPLGYPQIGYPIFLKICELLNNSSRFVIFVQVSINLFSVCFFYYSYFKSYGKYWLFVALLLLGYITSDINLYWNSFIVPDSLLSSFLIASLAVLMLIIVRKKLNLIYILSFLVVCSIAIRPSALNLLPILGLLLFYMIAQKENNGVIYKNITFFILLLGMLSTINYYAPPYKCFSVITFPTYNVSNISRQLLSSSNAELQSLKGLIPENNLLLIKEFENTTNLDSVYNIYALHLKRGYKIRSDLDTNFTFSGGDDINTPLDTNLVNNTDFYKVKQKFKSRYRDSIVSYKVIPNVKLKLAHSLMFFKYFYKDCSVINDIENRGFYTEDLKYRWKVHYVEDLWQPMAVKVWMLFFREGVTKRTAKEFSFKDKRLISDLNDIYEEMTNTKLYQYVIAPYYKIQPLLFRNILYPIVFIIVFFLSLYGTVRSRVESNLFLITLSASLCLLTILFLHSFYLNFLNMRYTYQVSFMYYIAMIFLPLIIESYIAFIKTGKFKY